MTDQAPDLLPCPFCGSDDVGPRKAVGANYIECRDCKTYGPTPTYPERAKDAWNTRTPPTRAELAQWIKPLVWEDGRYAEFEVCEGFTGYYKISRDEPDYADIYFGIKAGDDFEEEAIWFGLEADAKAAAEADYTRRLLAQFSSGDG